MVGRIRERLCRRTSERDDARPDRSGRKQRGESAHETPAARADDSGAPVSDERAELHPDQTNPARADDTGPPRMDDDTASRPGLEDRRKSREDGLPMESYRIEVGHVHGVQPGNIVGAIANEAGLDGKHIGHIDIRDDHSFVDLPEGMPKEIFRSLKKVRVCGAELRISRVDSKPPRPERSADATRRPHPGADRKPRFSPDSRKRSDARRPTHGQKRH